MSSGVFLRGEERETDEKQEREDAVAKLGSALYNLIPFNCLIHQTLHFSSYSSIIIFLCFALLGTSPLDHISNDETSRFSSPTTQTCPTSRWDDLEMASSSQ